MKVSLIRTGLVTVAISISLMALGQQNILLNQASYNLFVINPAAASSKNDLTVNCHYKKNWLGIASSPELVQVTIDGSAHQNKIGVGVNLANEKAGIFSRSYLSAALRYKLQINKSQYLSFGIGIGYQRQAADFSLLKASHPEEFYQWPGQQSATVPDGAAGILYSFKKLLIGLSAHQILQQRFIYREPTFNNKFGFSLIPSFNLFIQHPFKIGQGDWICLPTIILRSMLGLPSQFEVNQSLSYRNKLFFGLGYRSFYAFYGTVGFQVGNNLRLFYSYEYSQKVQAATLGGQEIGISFRIPSGSKTSNERERKKVGRVDEVMETLDEQVQRVEKLTTKIDSLERNNKILNAEINELKNKQVSDEELLSEVSSYSSEEQPAKYRKLTGESFSENNKDSASHSFQIVFGVYRSTTHAKEFQKFLKRELGIETKLIQLSDAPRRFIYVCGPSAFSSLQSAIASLTKTKSKISGAPVQITHGDIWILQTLKN